MEVFTKLTTHFQWKPRREMATVGAQAREEELVATTRALRIHSTEDPNKKHAKQQFDFTVC